MLEPFKRVLTAQFEAALSMMKGCLERCPDQYWDTPIAKYPFWQVVYHALCFVDLYLAQSEDAWQPRSEAGAGGGLHPLGRREWEEEYPSRRMERGELIEYVGICRQCVRDVISAETAESLSGESGFSWLPFSRCELHLCNLRHLQHHTGQLSACLHRLGVSAEWVKTGWR